MCPWPQYTVKTDSGTQCVRAIHEGIHLFTCLFEGWECKYVYLSCHYLEWKFNPRYQKSILYLTINIFLFLQENMLLVRFSKWVPTTYVFWENKKKLYLFNLLYTAPLNPWILYFNSLDWAISNLRSVWSVFISSSEHDVLQVSYCCQSMSAVRHLL